MKLLSIFFVLALLCSFGASQDAAIEVAVTADEVAVVVAAEPIQEVAVAVEACGCTKPSSAKAAFEAVLTAFSADLLADVTASFAPGVFSPCLAQTHLETISFGTPSYSIDLPNAVAGKVTWEYQFKGSQDKFNDGSLIFSVLTDADQKITSFLLSHDNANFEERVPRPQPASISALVNEFIGGLSSFSLRDSLEHTTSGFTLRILGDSSLLPHHLDTVVNHKNFAEFKDEYGQVFDFTSKSVRCLLQSEDEDSSVSHCQVVGKHSRVKFCLDALVFAEAEAGLLSSIDFYIAGACDPKTKFEDDEERAEKLRRENEKQEAKRKDEERKAEKAKEDADRKAQEAEKKTQKEKSKKKEGEKKEEVEKQA